jgi:hypothetical protein
MHQHDTTRAMRGGQEEEEEECVWTPSPLTYLVEDEFTL